MRKRASSTRRDKGMEPSTSLTPILLWALLRMKATASATCRSSTASTSVETRLRTPSGLMECLRPDSFSPRSMRSRISAAYTPVRNALGITLDMLGVVISHSNSSLSTPTMATSLGTAIS
ncbi:hypothetical protein D3C72_2144650 [compost metagenome]